jgi:hypothetical protein
LYIRPDYGRETRGMFLAGLNNSGIRAILPEPEIPKGGYHAPPAETR